MNKRLALIVAPIVVVAGAFAYVLLNKPAIETAKQEMQNKVSQDDTALAPPSPTTTATPGAYVDYSADVIAKTAGTKILFFHAPWCPQCRALDADIKANGVPEGVTIIKTDYDSNQALRQKYGVTIQTTIVRVDDAGNLVKKYVAYDNPTLAAIIKGVL